MPTRTDSKPHERRRRHAAESRRRTDERRRRAGGGASGWVAERAGDWSLDSLDPGWMEAQKYFWNPLCDYWFRMEIEGWEKLPDPPCLLVGIHSGAPFVWDAWTVGFKWWRHFGPDRPLHGTAHDALMAAPGISAYFRRMASCRRRPTRSLPRSRRAATLRYGLAARSTRCGPGPAATRRSSPAARAS